MNECQWSVQPTFPCRRDDLNPPRFHASQCGRAMETHQTQTSGILLLGGHQSFKDTHNASSHVVRDLIPSVNSFAFHLKISTSASGSAPFLSRLHPHASGWVIHHVHQPPGVTAALVPGMRCCLLQWPGGRVQTGRLTGHSLLNAHNGGWSGTCVRFLTHFHRANALEDHPRLHGGFWALLSHIVSFAIQSSPLKDRRGKHKWNR